MPKSLCTFLSREKEEGGAQEDTRLASRGLGTWKGGGKIQQMLLIITIVTFTQHLLGRELFKEFTWVINPGDPHNNPMRKYY